MSGLVSSHTPIPASVIIDSRNLAGQAKEVLGKPRYPSVAGVREALAAYGFAVEKVIAAVATRSQGNAARSPRVSKALQINCDFAERIRADGGVVAEGYLRDDYGPMEEKQVDVLCARAIADEAYAVRHAASPARAIVLLSKDADLIPMFSFAHDLGVPVYAAASSTVHDRRLDHWLLLGQAALCTMTGMRGMVGHGLRDRVAEFALRRWDRHYSWTVVGTVHRSGVELVRLLHSCGVQGIASLAEFGGRAPAHGSVHALYPAGIDAGEWRRELPELALVAVPPTRPSPELTTAVVIGRIGPTRAEIRLANGVIERLEIPVDNMCIGREILVHCTRRSVRLVGGLDAPTPGASPLLTPTLVEVTGIVPGTGAAKGLLPDGSTVLVRLPRNDRGGIGSRYVAMAAGSMPDGFPLVQAISSRLVP